MEQLTEPGDSREMDSDFRVKPRVSDRVKERKRQKQRCDGSIVQTLKDNSMNNARSKKKIKDAKQCLMEFSIPFSRDFQNQNK